MQNANDVIDHLAAKLSVPAAHLWAVLVRQAQAEAIANAVLIVLYLAFVAVVAKSARRYWTWFRETNSDSMEEVAGGISLFLVIAFLICGAIASIINLYQITLYVVNPEYYAVAKILSALK